MSFEITKEHEPQDVWVADRRLWLTADQKAVVEDGDGAAAFLLCGPGQSIPRARAEELGLIEPEAKEQEKPEDKQLDPPEDKQRANPGSKKKSRKTARKKK